MIEHEKDMLSKELKALVEFGVDIEFECNGQEYAILPWTDDGIVIGENNGDDSVYDSYEEMINGYVIDGMIMKDIMPKIKITFTSGC